MPCQIQIHAKPALIEAVYQGALTANELGTAANDIVALIRKHDIHLVLADCTALEGGHTVIDLCALADWLAANHSDLFIKEAVVLPALPQADDHARFWETACRNRGIVVRVFSDRDSALEGLVK